MSNSSQRPSSSRANVCVVAFCGLPASGKTTAAMKLMDFSRWRGIESQVIHVDEYTRGGRGEECQFEDPKGFDPQHYKDGRQAALQKLKQLLCDYDASGQREETSDKDAAGYKLLIVDDTLHLRSMRAQIWRICRDFQAAFVVIYVRCSIDLALQYNSMRGCEPSHMKIPQHVLIKTAAAFEPPSRLNGPWDRHCIEFYKPSKDRVQISFKGSSMQSRDDYRYEDHVDGSELTDSKLLEHLWEVVWAAWELAPRPVLAPEISESMRKTDHESKPDHTILHQLDIETREVLNRAVRSFRTVPGVSVADLSRSLNMERRRKLDEWKLASNSNTQTPEDFVEAFKLYCKSLSEADCVG